MSTTMMTQNDTARIEIHQQPNGQYRWLLLVEDGVVVDGSAEDYATETAAQQAAL